jgi:uncharacterized protein YyaL (SSP411 family)
MANKLVNEASPYLLQHAHNPVEWHPWGPEALDRARREDKPIFLSIGYSACHWCHVMERESFEDQGIANRLNERFVCIKVDREERPDLDHIYMNAVQALTGRGGWPMSVFLTPDLRPFYGGTYWPPHAARGMPGFDEVIEAISNAWSMRRDAAQAQAQVLMDHLAAFEPVPAASDQLNEGLLRSAAGELLRAFDPVHGGFGAAPKFPQPMAVQLALRLWNRFGDPRLLSVARTTLDRMRRGGIYDHLAGGFARYSVDDRWLVPHFEKMLYDNALLTDAYLDAFRATGCEDFSRVARETIDYVLSYLTDPTGGFHSTEDADSEGEEGKFYLWTPQEIEEVLGRNSAEQFCYVYGVTPEGNFEHRNILNLPNTIEQCARIRGWDAGQLERDLAAARRQLLVRRDQRIRPAKDDKILLDWNALMIHSLAKAAGVLDAPRYLDAAIAAAEFILHSLRTADGRLLHSWRHGTARHPAYLDDYTHLLQAMATLYEATFDERWVVEAMRIADILITRFRDRAGCGFFFTADDHERLITRHKDIYDNATPSGNAVAATALLRLARLTGSPEYQGAAEQALQLSVPVMQRSALAGAQSLAALDMYLGPSREIVLLGDSNDRALETQLLGELRRSYVPNAVVAVRAEPAQDLSDSPLKALFAGKSRMAVNSPTVYVCENSACQPPASDAAEIRSIWKKLAAK